MACEMVKVAQTVYGLETCMHMTCTDMEKTKLNKNRDAGRLSQLTSEMAKTVAIIIHWNCLNLRIFDPASQRHPDWKTEDSHWRRV